MKHGIDNVIYSALKSNEDPINILYMGYDGIFDTILSTTPNTNFFIYKPKALCRFWGAPLSNKFTYIDNFYNIPNRIDLDVIICNDRKEQIFVAEKMSHHLHIPIVVVEHNLPSSKSKPSLRQYINSRMPNSRCVIPHKTIKDEWYMSDDVDIIPYGIPIQKRIIKHKNVVVVNNFQDSNSDVLNKLLTISVDTIGVGYNGGRTQEYKHFGELIEFIRSAVVCITLVDEDGPPFIPLLAMGCGTVVLTNKTRWTTQIITEGENGFLFDGLKDARKKCKSILGDKDLVEDVIYNAYQYISNNHEREKFCDRWTNLIKSVIRKPYIR